MVWTWRWTTGSALSDLGTNPRHDTLVAEGACPVVAWFSAPGPPVAGVDTRVGPSPLVVTSALCAYYWVLRTCAQEQW